VRDVDFTELEGVAPGVHNSYAGIGACFLIVLDDLAARGAKP
jgi:hypothetical protein